MARESERCFKSTASNERIAVIRNLSWLVAIGVGAWFGTFEVAADDFPKPFDSLKDAGATATSPKDALASLQVPPGFQTLLAAAEPMVQNPIAATWDARGRLWIAENFTYGDGANAFERGLRDRVLILEDTDGDGVFDSRKVFTDNVQMLTSIEVGHGGVWLMCPPRVIFIPDQNGDDVPDGPAVTVLDGFDVGTDSPHNFANGLRWGQDGWLYGRCGGTCPALVGVPGTPKEERVPLWGGMWRFNPVTKIYESLVTGTTNPWGHDWNSLGELFFINTVNGHFWHVIPGSHFDRHTGLDPNTRTYELIAHHADHWHFDTGKSWQQSRDGVANDLGGGHAHTGGMVYLGDNWPKEHRDRFYMINMHGRRLNAEILDREGSGYMARHAKDLVISTDPWFRPVEVSYGPDGGGFIFDWADSGECHERDGVHRSSGRIYKVTYGTPKAPGKFDLSKKSNVELAELHQHPNEWYARRARLVLCERSRAGQPMTDAQAELLKLYQSTDDRALRMRALLSLFVIDGTPKEFLLEQFNHPDEAVRTWAVRMLTDSWPLEGPGGIVPRDPAIVNQVRVDAQVLLPRLVSLAKSDSSGLVRLALASTLQRLPVTDRAALAAALVSRSEDANDHNLPLLVWYGLISLADSNPQALVPVLQACEWPKTRALITRRLGEEVEKQPEIMNQVLSWGATQPPQVQQDLIAGLGEALRGWRKAKAPAGWKDLQASIEKSGQKELIERARELSVVFGDGRALDEVKKIVLDKSAPMDARNAALQTLIENRPGDLREICQKVVGERNLNLTAAKGLSLFDDEKIGEQMVNAYRAFLAPDRPQVISLLVSRPSFATALLKAISAGKIPRDHLTAFHVRQIHSLQNEELSRLTAEVWGELRDSSEEKKQLMDGLKARLTDEVLAGADLSKGRALFNATCAKCHKLYGEGIQVGPDLTGSNRNDMHYLLENMIDPSAVVAKDFRMIVLVLDDGRVLNGVITQQADRTLTLQTLTDAVTIDKTSIEERRQTTLSPMPEGLLQNLNDDQIRDLIAYLRHPSQVPLPAAASTTSVSQ